MKEAISKRTKVVLDNYSTLESRFNEVHNGKYSYHKSVFTRQRDPITVTCKKHGDFDVRPSDHLDGNGCPECNGRITNTKAFVRKANSTHGDTYTYLNTVYMKSKSKVVITCKVHGDFEQLPTAHISGQGCALCGKKSSNFNRSTYKDRNSYLYIVLVANKYYKIGITVYTPEYRLKYCGAPIKVIRRWKFTDGSDAYNAERALLNATINTKYKGPKIMMSGNTKLRTESPIPVAEKLFQQNFDGIILNEADAAQL